MMLKARKTKRVNLPAVNVNITSLLDVLTVLLFFLVKSFSVSEAQTKAPEDIRLPASISQDKLEEGITVALGPNGLIHEGKVIAKTTNGRFRKEDLGTDHRTILPLKALLDHQHQKRSEVFAQAAPDMIPPGKIIIQADRELRFETLKHLLHTASSSNYPDFQFIVTAPGN